MQRIFAVVALAATTLAVTVKGFKANTSRAQSGLPTGKGQHKPATLTKPIDI